MVSKDQPLDKLKGKNRNAKRPPRGPGGREELERHIYTHTNVTRVLTCVPRLIMRAGAANLFKAFVHPEPKKLIPEREPPF